MTKTLKDTSDMCNDLKQGMHNTQDVLYGLKSLNAVEEQDANLAEINTADESTENADNIEALDIRPKQKQYDKIEEENKLISFFSRR